MIKNIKKILLAGLVTAGFFGGVVFTSCTKASCETVICQNGGACSNGECVCPTGFSGTLCETASTSSIVYQNNTFTPISITVNGVSKTIPVGGLVAYTGRYGTDALGGAVTSGAATSLGVNLEGGLIGVTINWSISNPYPEKDTLKVPLDIGSTYFFLRLTNKGAKDIINYYVNYDFPYGNYYGDVTIPNNGQTYDLGYYLAYSSSNVQTQSSDSKVVWQAVSLPFTKNQSISVTVN